MIAIIPARGGSKRIPRKNIKLFMGIPAIVRTINITKESGIFDKILVSTEDPEIARIANEAGAEILMRDENLAGDHTTTVEVISNALDLLKDGNGNEPDYVCCIYPVTPTLTAERLKEAADLIQSRDLDYVFTAKKFESSPDRAIKIGIHQNSEMCNPAHLNTRTQDLPDYYHDAAMFYLGKSSAWRASKPILHGEGQFIVLDKYETLDIDDEEDWRFAEELFRIRSQKAQNIPVNKKHG